MITFRNGAVLLTTLALASVSMAQSGLTFRVGGTYPLNKTVRDGIDKNGYAFGLDLATKKCPYIPGSQSLTLDFSRVIGGDNRIDSWSLGYLTRVSLNLLGGRFYGGFGAGIAYNAAWTANTQVAQVSSNSTINSTTGRFGNQVLTATALIGTQVRQNWNVELQYRHIGKIAGANPSFLGLFLGYQF